MNYCLDYHKTVRSLMNIRTDCLSKDFSMGLQYVRPFAEHFPTAVAVQWAH